MVLEGASVTMGLEQTVVFSTHAVPVWRQVQHLLASRGFPLQIRMINDQLAFPDEMPEEPWRELRVGTAADMVTLRRGPDRVTLVTWANADVPLVRMRNAIAWALAEAGAGHIQSPARSSSARTTPAGHNLARSQAVQGSQQVLSMSLSPLLPLDEQVFKAPDSARPSGTTLSPDGVLSSTTRVASGSLPASCVRASSSASKRSSESGAATPLKVGVDAL
jgi:hypothetical protein